MAVLRVGDELAKRASAAQWTDEMSNKAIKTLAAAVSDFQPPAATGQGQARRAERLVLALDRLSASRKKSQPARAADTDLNRLFKLVQSLPEFDAAKFVEALNQFSHSLEE